MSEPRVESSGSGTRFSLWRVLAGVIIGIMVLPVLVQLLLGRWPHQRSRRLICHAHLQSLGVAFVLYSQENGNVYPPASKWCDLLVGRYAREESLHCDKGKEGQCDYAMNPLADPCGAPDIVLLFECRAGWNQAGGQEILSTKHHEGRGSNILFVDGHVEFIGAEKVPLLRWK